MTQISTLIQIRKKSKSIGKGYFYITFESICLYDRIDSKNLKTNWYIIDINLNFILTETQKNKIDRSQLTHNT